MGEPAGGGGIAGGITSRLKAYREQGKGQGSEQYIGAWKASKENTMEEVNEDPVLNSISHSALSRQIKFSVGWAVQTKEG